eukprot:3900386-Prymnesium_polylepis.3
MRACGQKLSCDSGSLTSNGMKTYLEGRSARIRVVRWNTFATEFWVESMARAAASRIMRPPLAALWYVM